MAKIAFELPKKYKTRKNGIYLGSKEFPDELVENLFNLWGDRVICELISEDICNPDLLVVEFNRAQSPEQCQEHAAKIQKCLEDFKP